LFVVSILFLWVVGFSFAAGVNQTALSSLWDAAVLINSSDPLMLSCNEYMLTDQSPVHKDEYVEHYFESTKKKTMSVHGEKNSSCLTVITWSSDTVAYMDNMNSLYFSNIVLG
jgi:hypothetical protein